MNPQWISTEIVMKWKSIMWKSIMWKLKTKLNLNTTATSVRWSSRAPICCKVTSSHTKSNLNFNQIINESNFESFAFSSSKFQEYLQELSAPKKIRKEIDFEYCCEYCPTTFKCSNLLLNFNLIQSHIESHQQ